ncbi:CPBP family intramembrane glutamic endopeptidase [Sphingomonas sp.]|uniref:CPBP family intramembrane glutamic endopeptidase n=1 Tax=Sphingomonas sp. TaxID=28214 RepID=UPI002CD478A2|nr:CPBP family intramembrane glutamic endopeptidase [Sphingomonas sp.]HWK36559.1 CPBP family intramembrane glutamic endopeptidase [Sphingomonas sp.]
MGRLVELGDARVLRPGRLRWLRAVGWMMALIALMLVAFIAANSLVILIGAAIHHTPVRDPALLPPIYKAAALVLAAAAVFASYVAAVRLGEARRPSELAPRALVPELAIGLAVGAAVMIGTGVILWATGWGSFRPQPVTAIAGALSESIESGVVEEIVFRLIILRLLWRAFGVWTALAVSAALFGLLHLGNPNATLFAAICIAFEAGILLAAFYILTGRLWMSIGVHAGWNFTQGWLLGAAVSGGGGFAGGPLAHSPAPGVNAVLSGGGFGPEASLPALALCTAVGLGVLWLAWTRGRMGEAEA